MSINLPAPDKRQLSNSPLDLVVCQIRYETNLSVGDNKVALALHEALGGRHGRYARAEQIQAHALNVAMGPGVEPAVSSAAPLVGWRFVSGDADWIVSVMPDHVALETSAYANWEGDFRDRLGELLAVVAEYLSPAFEQRLGLRYIDRLTQADNEAPQDWSHAIRNELLGAALHEGFASAVIASRQEIVLSVEESVRCTLRHGFVRESDEPSTYLLDYDIHRQESRPFDVDAVMTAADQFNEVGLQLFQASLKPDYWESLI